MIILDGTTVNVQLYVHWTILYVGIRLFSLHYWIRTFKCLLSVGSSYT